jgi:hypothetical protein
MSGYLYYDAKMQNVRKSVMNTDLVMAMKNPQSGEAMEMPMSNTVETVIVPDAKK